MKKINFIDNETKGNAETFNTMQDNIEEAINENANKSISIYDITEAVNGRWIRSKIPFSTDGIMFFIFQACSSWSNDVYQVAFFDSSNEKISIFGTWESSSEGTTFAYTSVFKKIDDYNICVYKYAQDAGITSNAWRYAGDSDYGAIRPNKIYAVSLRKDL